MKTSLNFLSEDRKDAFGIFYVVIDLSTLNHPEEPYRALVLYRLEFCIDLSLSRTGREFTFTKLSKLIDFMVCKIKRTWRKASFALQIEVTKITKLTRPGINCTHLGGIK